WPMDIGRRRRQRPCRAANLIILRTQADHLPLVLTRRTIVVGQRTGQAIELEMIGATGKEPRAEASPPRVAGPVTGNGEVAGHLDKNIRRSRVPGQSIKGEGITGIPAIGNIVTNRQNRIAKGGIAEDSDRARAVAGLVGRNSGGGGTSLAQKWCG